MLENFFKSLDIKTYTINKANDSEIVDIFTSNEINSKEMTILTVESISSIFKILLPVIRPYYLYLYWKYDQYELMSRVARLVNAKAHYTLYGFITLIEIIYSYPNKRHQSKQFWLDIIQSWFKARASETKSGENNIQAIYGRGTLKGSIIA
jgi:hypothetical protein